MLASARDSDDYGPIGKGGYAPMMDGGTPATSNGWETEAVFTVGERIRNYTPPGILDGVGTFKAPKKGYVRVLVNHELGSTVGYPYSLANGTELKGARVSFFDISDSKREVKESGLAYRTMYDRTGAMVTNAAQVGGGLQRLCSARGVSEGEFNFEDDIFFTGEETGGGTQWALDVQRQAMWAVPAMGVGGWEGWTPVDSGDESSVALLGGDDTGGSPLYLYQGEKGPGDSPFLERNGLAEGTLSCWKADDDSIRTAAEFHGFFNTTTGSFVSLTNYDPAEAGNPGWDAQGYATQANLDMQTLDAGCFYFARPEDVHNNPANPTEMVFNATGTTFTYMGSSITADRWGTVYKVALDFAASTVTAQIKILHDADALPIPDMGIRSPDNLTWANDGAIYIQEDRSSPSGTFGTTTGAEASLWKLSPESGDFVRIAEMSRFAVAPAGSTDPVPTDIGNWESSGIVDVTNWFKTEEDETLLLGVVQAHSVTDGVISSSGLVEGGQLIFYSREQDTGADDDKGKGRHDQ
jgi:secreted PhoX family phosphatase